MIEVLKICVAFTILLDAIAILKVAKDNQYLLDNEKPKLYLIIPNFALEGATDVLVLGSRGVEGKRRRSRRVR